LQPFRVAGISSPISAQQATEAAGQQALAFCNSVLLTASDAETRSHAMREELFRPVCRLWFGQLNGNGSRLVGVADCRMTQTVVLRHETAEAFHTGFIAWM